RGLFETIKADLLFGDGLELELMAVSIGQKQINEARGVSQLSVMKEQLACEAEVTTVAHALQVRALGPAWEILSQPALLQKRLEACIDLLIDLFELPVDGWWPLVIIS